MAGLEDISAMKLNAISGNGTRLKGFIDIAYLSFLTYTLAQMVNAYAQKYSSRNPVKVIKALNYQNDIDFNEPIEMISDSYSWKKVKKRLDIVSLSPVSM